MRRDATDGDSLPDVWMEVVTKPLSQAGVAISDDDPERERIASLTAQAYQQVYDALRNILRSVNWAWYLKAAAVSVSVGATWIRNASDPSIVLHNTMTEDAYMVVHLETLLLRYRVFDMRSVANTIRREVHNKINLVIKDACQDERIRRMMLICGVEWVGLLGTHTEYVQFTER